MTCLVKRLECDDIASNLDPDKDRDLFNHAGSAERAILLKFTTEECLRSDNNSADRHYVTEGERRQLDTDSDKIEENKALGDNVTTVESDYSITENQDTLTKARVATVAETDRDDSCDCTCTCAKNRDFEFNQTSDCQVKAKHNSEDTCRKCLFTDDKNADDKKEQLNCSKIRFRPRTKSENSGSGISELTKSRCKCSDYFSGAWIKKNMANILCQCFIVLALCACGGFVLVNSSKHRYHSAGDKDSVNHRLAHSGLKLEDSHDLAKPSAQSVLLDMPFRGVTIDEFERHLEKSTSSTEMLKIFFADPTLTDDQVSSIMFTKKHHAVYSGRSRHGRRDLMMNDAESDHDRYQEEAFKHSREMATNPLYECSVPLPVLERVEEAHSDSVKFVLPRCTIVHRCQNTTACCPRGSICAPKKENGIEIIEKHFMVYEITPGSDKIAPSTDEFIQSRSFINHTACECQKIEIYSNCDRACPSQFHKQRRGVDCECRCVGGTKKCHRIQRGFHPLDEVDLECIKVEECIKPKCHHGEFNLNTGFCPKTKHRRKSRG